MSEKLCEKYIAQEFRHRLPHAGRRNDDHVGGRFHFLYAESGGQRRSGRPPMAAHRLSEIVTGTSALSLTLIPKPHIAMSSSSSKSFPSHGILLVSEHPFSNSSAAPTEAA